MAASVSVDYYTRLEQGREANPSDEVLTAIALALDLPADDLRHAILLRDGGNPRVPLAPPSRSDSLGERMQAVVDAWAPCPAYALDFRSDVIAANQHAFELFLGLDEIADDATPNTCRYLLTEPQARWRFVEWEEVARRSVASLREHSTTYAHEVGFAEFVAELTRVSPEFAQWWKGYAVSPRRSASKVFRSRHGGTFTLNYEVMTVPETDVRLTVYLGEVPDAAERL